MARHRLAAHPKPARRQGADLALSDESGRWMAPRVRRAWAPRGQTPHWHQQSGRREKVAVAAAVWRSPRRDHLGLFFKTLVNGEFDTGNAAAFLEALVKELAGRVAVVWDGGGPHHGDPIRDLQDVRADRLSIAKLPPSAPIRNPAEPVWSGLKWDQLSNVAPDHATHLNARVVRELTAIQDDQEALRGFWKASELPLPRALFS